MHHDNPERRRVCPVLLLAIGVATYIAALVYIHFVQETERATLDEFRYSVAPVRFAEPQRGNDASQRVDRGAG